MCKKDGDSRFFRGTPGGGIFKGKVFREHVTDIGSGGFRSLRGGNLGFALRWWVKVAKGADRKREPLEWYLTGIKNHI